MAMTRGAKNGLAVIAFLLFVVWLASVPRSPTRPSSPSSAAQPVYYGPDGTEVAPPPATSTAKRAQQQPRFLAFIPDVGSVVRLYNGTASVLIGTDDDALGEMDKATRVKDDHGRVQLVMGGKILLVASGTRARVLDIGFFTHEIRILEGKHQGRKGWVRKEFVGGYVVR